MEILPEDINFGVIPFSHSYGLSNLVTPLLYQGTALVCSSDRMPRAIHQHLIQSKATVFPGNPALFQALSALADTHNSAINDLGALRFCISAGAPLSPHTSQQFFERFGVKIHNFYGSSECGGIAYDRNAHPGELLGYIGSPMRFLNIQKLKKGHIAIFGDNVADGYFPEPDPSVLDGKRFVPGDLIHWGHHGLRIYGRASDFVNVAGKKVHPVTIEEHLRKRQGVLDAVVFGVHSDARNEELIAYVACEPEVTYQDLKEHCQAKLTSWQVPRDFVLLRELPVNSRGKINRKELAQHYVKEARS